MFIIEGNIGAGKSTFLTLISDYLPSAAITFEPVQDWQQHVYGQSLLSNFYQEPKRWAFTLETLALITRVRKHLHDQSSSNPLVFVERSIYSGHYCFTQNSFESGYLHPVEWDIYNEWFTFLTQQKCTAPQGFIYLKTDPSIAYERIKKRNRLAEKKLSFSYLKSIHQKHEDFLITKKHHLDNLSHVPVLEINCDAEFETDKDQLTKHMERVMEFVISASPAPISPELNTAAGS